MTEDDVLFGFRLRLFTLAEELGNVSEACRAMGVARSTYCAWKPKLERYGLDQSHGIAQVSRSTRITTTASGVPTSAR